jgi:hypothetical protein
MKKSILVMLIFISILSCRKIPDLDQLTLNFVVITNRDQAADFTSYTKYFISDTVTYISNNPGDDTVLVGAPAAALVGAVKSNLDSRGYQSVPRLATPDLGVKVVAINQLSGGVTYPPGWWWGYPGYPGYCYWGWCYPPYYPYPVVYSYNTGDILIEVFDLKNATANNTLRVVWNMQGSGVLSSTDQVNLDLATDAIDQGFEQSPYFRRN